MCPHGYCTLLRESKDPRYLRLRMVQHAKREGVDRIEEALRRFQIRLERQLGRKGLSFDDPVQHKRARHDGMA